ncbi:MAG TPA: hypothetical protein VNC78_09070 [Actinomycetota bacterium]|nr:hypothetical protein [Actinomycetota bacterium]
MPRMVRHIAPLMAVVLVVMMSPVSYGDEADTRVERTKKTGYGVIPAGTPGMPPPSCSVVRGWRPSSPNCVRLATKKGERYISVEIEDRSGLPVAGYIWVKPPRVMQDYVGGFNDLHPFCGATSSPVPIRGGRPVMVYVNVGEPFVALHCHPGLATIGTVSATFLRSLPPSARH